VSSIEDTRRQLIHRLHHSPSQYARDRALTALARMERYAPQIETAATAWLTVVPDKPDGWKPMRCQRCDGAMAEGGVYVYRHYDRLKVCVPCADADGVSYRPSRRYVARFGEPGAVLVESAVQQPQHEVVDERAVAPAHLAVDGVPLRPAAPGD
jgi:hypothetical protein